MTLKEGAIPEGVERRITHRLLAYWNELRGSDDFPSENDLDPDVIADMWDNCFLVQVRDLVNVEDYNYTYLGKAISKAYLAGLTDQEGSPIASPNANRLAHSYNKVLETREPLVEEGEFTNLRGALVKYRQILLPLGVNGKIEAVFGGMRFKIFGTDYL